MRKLKTVVVFDKETYDGEWPPENAVECVQWFADKVDTIPKEHRGAATIEIEGEHGYEGSVYGRILIAYKRPESDAEQQDRETVEAYQSSANQEREKKTLEFLKNKYEK